jgi:orotate phosphoribosyltransferase
MSREIAEALVAIDGVGFATAAPITFKSGIKSPVYCDNRKFPFHPAQWVKVIRGFETLILETPIRADVIAGIEAAGIPHSAALGFALRTPSVFVRKEAKGYGAKKRVEGGDVAGKCTVLIEDLVTTGSSSLSGVEALRAEGAVVADCLAIISYGFAEGMQNFAAAGVKLHTLTNFFEVLEVAMEQGKISANEAATVQNWLRDPHGWAARNGFE